MLWNKKNKTIDVLNDFRKVKRSLIRKEFEKYLKQPGTTIPVSVIINAINEDSQIRTQIVELLNHHEGIAVGILQGLYDEEIVKYSRKSSFQQVYNEYKEFIEHRKNISNMRAWKNFEILIEKWNN